MRECPYCKHRMSLLHMMIPFKNHGGYRCDACGHRSLYSKKVGLVGWLILCFSFPIFFQMTIKHYDIVNVVVPSAIFGICFSVLLEFVAGLLCPLYPIEGKKDKKES